MPKNLMCASQGYPIQTNHTSILVRAKGIEPSSKAWEAFVLPLYHARDGYNVIMFNRYCPELNKTIWCIDFLRFQTVFVMNVKLCWIYPCFAYLIV